MFYAGPGQDLIVGGGGTTGIATGPGADTIVAGKGAVLIGFAHGNDVTALVQNFNVTSDFLTLTGFSSGEAARTVANQTFAAGATTLTFSDGSRVTFADVAHISASVFI